MDPLTALSLAGTIVQFVDFGSKLVKEGHSFYKSATGALPINDELELTTNDLRALIAKVRQHLPKEEEDVSTEEGDVLTEGEGEDLSQDNFETICNMAAKVAEKIARRLDKLKIKGTKYKPWESFKHAVKSAWKQEELRGLVGRLSSLKEALHSRILFSIWQSIDTNAICASARFDNLDKQTQHILTTILNSTKFITDSVSNDLQEQTSKLTYTLSQLVSRLEGVAGPQHDKSHIAESGSVYRRASWGQNITADIEMLDVPHDEETRIRNSIATSILDKLWYSSMTDRYEDVVEAYPQTFEWIFREPVEGNRSWSNFPEWLRTGNGIYWISGKAGSGKSTLMKHIFDDPRTRVDLSLWASKNPLCVATFFFWNTGVNEQKSQSGLLRALLHQVLHQYRDLIPVLFPVEWASQYSATINNTELPFTKWSLRRLIGAFTTLIEQSSFPLSICFLIDGLDEFEGDYEELGAIAMLFKNIANSPLSNVKVCLSSRPWVIFEDLFASGPNLRLHNLTRDDVEKFVAGKLDDNNAFHKLATKEPNMAPALIREIVDSADGVFLWVKLVVISLLSGLKNRDDIAILQKRLRLLPKELEPLYSHLLGLIEPFYQHWASRAFQIVRLSREYASRPFGISNRSGEGPLPPSIAEFYIAITDDVDFDTLRDMTLSELATWCQETEVHLTARCAGLLEVNTPAEGAADPFCRRVQYLHKTVGEFLEKNDHWPDILPQSVAINFSPNFSMLRGCVLSSSMTCNSLLSSELSELTAKRQHVLTVMTYAHHAERHVETHEIQTELLDLMDKTLSFRMGNRYLSILLPTYDQKIESSLAFATLFDLRHYVLEKLSKVPERSVGHTASKLLQILSVNFGKNLEAALPLPSAEMVSLLMTFRADPHWRYKCSTAWLNMMDFIERTSVNTSRKLDTVAYLRMIKILATSIPSLLSYGNVTWECAAVSAWRILTQTPLRTYPNETKDILRELELRIPRVILDKHPVGSGGYRPGSQIKSCDEGGMCGNEKHNADCNKRGVEEVSDAEEQEIEKYAKGSQLDRNPVSGRRIS